jgi:SAM domain (Sterile alpha motif)
MGTNLDIDSWLRGIGLAQYTELFCVNDIDGELLGRLTSDDLKEIGVASLGHRWRRSRPSAQWPKLPPRRQSPRPRRQQRSAAS